MANHKLPVIAAIFQGAVRLFCCFLCKILENQYSALCELLDYPLQEVQAVAKDKCAMYELRIQDERKREMLRDQDEEQRF